MDARFSSYNEFLGAMEIAVEAGEVIPRGAIEKATDLRLMEDGVAPALDPGEAPAGPDLARIEWRILTLKSKDYRESRLAIPCLGAEDADVLENVATVLMNLGARWVESVWGVSGHPVAVCGPVKAAVGKEFLPEEADVEAAAEKLAAVAKWKETHDGDRKAYREWLAKREKVRAEVETTVFLAERRRALEVNDARSLAEYRDLVGGDLAKAVAVFEKAAGAERAARARVILSRMEATA